VFVNSSLQTSVPDGIFGEKLWLATELDISTGAPPTAIALTVRFDATRKGA
jgi:hypothetical protein